MSPSRHGFFVPLYKCNTNNRLVNPLSTRLSRASNRKLNLNSVQGIP